ncbi:MAG: hypothetical protein B6I25_01640 [Planctomycetales bacterium 4572_13]|nr:MAG: hypothetical protein B6I25_01640 [Planctomycetales bacterium 4572_13]
MEANQARPQNMIDTTDALEAVSACQSMKNFLFTLILIGLVLCQIVFWMDHFGRINKDGCLPCKDAAPAICPTTCPKEQCSIEPKPQANAQKTGQVGALVFLAATTEPVQQAEPVATEAEEGKAIEQAIDEIVESANQENPDAAALGEDETDMLPVEVTDSMAEASTDNAQPAPEQAAAQEPDFSQVALSLFRISCPFAAGVVAVCNFVIITAVILYGLTLLMCLKISLAARLGGINHIARAFFISLFLLVIVTPWQVVLPKVLIGTIWLPGELLCGGWAKADSSIFWKVMFYLRFCGLPFVMLWLLLWTQIRSGKWTRATLRRLGVMR